MSNPFLHNRLVALQSTAELERKAERAKRVKGNRWTQEEIDWAKRKGAELAEKIDAVRLATT